MWRRSFRTAPHQGTGQLPLVQSRACNMTNFAFAQTAAWRGSRWWPGQRRACAKRSRSCAPCVAEHRPAAVAVSAVSPASKGPSLLGRALGQGGGARGGRGGRGGGARRRVPHLKRPAAGGGCGRTDEMSIQGNWTRPQRGHAGASDHHGFSATSSCRRGRRQQEYPTTSVSLDRPDIYRQI